MHVTLVVWDDENEAEIVACGFTIEDVNDIVHNRTNPAVYKPETDGSLPLCRVTGTTRNHQRIAVDCAFVCGNPLEVYPISASLA